MKLLSPVMLFYRLCRWAELFENCFLFWKIFLIILSLALYKTFLEKDIITMQRVQSETSLTLFNLHLRLLASF